MDSQAVAAIVVLVLLELVALRASQQAFPSLYFTTSSFFDRRADVSGKAVLFRLSIPLASGAIAAFLVPDDALLVAGIAGAVCWFLVIWPMIWNPKLISSHGLTPLFLALLAAFWLAFAALPVAAAALVEIARDVFAGDAGEIETQYVWALVTGMSFGICVGGVNWFAGKRLTFADDAASAETSEGSETKPKTEIDDLDGLDDLDLSFGDRLIVYGSEIFGFLALGVCAVAVVVLARRRN